MDSTSTLALEETRPRLVDGAQFVPFNTHVTYLKNAVTGDFLKLSSHEAALARYFNGKFTLAEILNKHLETVGTKYLISIAEILFSLKKSGFIVNETNGRVDSIEESLRTSDFFGALQSFNRFISRDLYRFKGGFRNRVCKKIAGALTSTAGLFALVLSSALCFVLVPDFHVPLIDFGTISGPGSATNFTIGYYGAFLALLWLSVGMILSAKNLLTAYALSSKDCKVYHPRIRSVCGFIYFDCTLTDIVSAGSVFIIKLFGLRMFLPLLLLQAVSALSPFYTGSPLLPVTIKKACFLVAAFSITPLVKTDLNNMLYLLTRSTRDFYQCMSYLGKRFFFKAEAYTSQPRGENDFCIIIALLSLVWLAGVGKFLWSAAQSAFFFLADGLAKGSLSLENAYVPLQLLTMLVPFIILIVMAVLVGASNVRYVLRAPVHRLIDVSKRMERAPASKPVVSFVRQLPLFTPLSEDQLSRLCAQCSIVNYKAGKKIILRGTAGDSFYIILSGKTRIVIGDTYGEERVVNVLSTGDCFGEIALIENVPRTATVIAASPVSLLKLERRHFEEFLAALPVEKKRITDSIRHGKLLMSIPLFTYLSPDQFSYLIDHCNVESFKKDEVIFRQGEVGDKFYIIKEGLVTVSRLEDERQVLVKTIEKGSVFGEIALVKNLPRTAQATAASDLCVLSLHKDCFYELIGKSLLTGAEFDRLADRRMAEMDKNPTDIAV
jgi:CRP-like cAMP-binding protein